MLDRKLKLHFQLTYNHIFYLYKIFKCLYLTNIVVPDIPLYIYIVLIYKDNIKYGYLHQHFTSSCIAAVSPNTS